MANNGENTQKLAILVWQDRLNLVLVDEALLILDLAGWARSHVDERLLSAEILAKQRHYAMSAECAEESAVWSRWLADMSKAIIGHPMLALRQAIAPLTVGEESYGRFVRALIEHSTVKRAFSHRDVANVEVLITESRHQYISDRCDLLVGDMRNATVDPDAMGNLVAQEMLQIAAARE